ncbi:Plasma membrane t-SNARE, secretory vesicle fusion [Orbilia oligospora]|uniref:Plasma membrane t-SNARE, secretory vesicle fusion n=2 Tax=Orbilia oligospora TaxID=2813651 RepID=A0A7C8J5N0_ORBOL|nr:Plasma membrane t-SNARE, secretory vesicle fusion [Orbilia oligospora]KAF3085010.1 Plasma membrane t-SNARE, secretory vesicle fusion [Orbilia oligospora]KAF3098104.1 Plasma membrane t-SNARE, secretory vesicle fusion [Orbilia oligospora]KAF3124393.1 Plasma membrane t-SNARE, secretory vesicle fusion [Orbilia oligospora]KAF3148413.1 Plasma membrane t-SNARE, secretory vesicle fusion [Orbilia oligospora]
MANRSRSCSPMGTVRAPEVDLEKGVELEEEVNPTQAFFNEVAVLRQENKDIQAKIQIIRELQAESLSKVTDEETAAVNNQISAQVAELSKMNAEMTRRIKLLASKTKEDSDHANHVKLIEKEFKQAIHRYQEVEVEYKKKMREQLARQYLIVNPDATEEDIKKVQEEGNQPIFLTAIMDARREQGSSALNEVRNRYKEIQKIEQTMEELADLFTQLNQLVYQQDEAIQESEDKARKTAEDVEAGANTLGVAIEHAKRARKNKWWLLIIVFIIIIIILFAVLFTIKPWE